MSSFWAVGIAAESVNPFEEPEEDGLVWLAGQWWTPWAMLAVFTIVGFWMVRSLVLHRGRAPQIERAAAASAMQYREQDGFGLSTVKFQHMAKGEGRGWTASQVVTMEASDGADVHAFDVRSWTDYAVSELPTVKRNCGVIGWVGVRSPTRSCAGTPGRRRPPPWDRSRSTRRSL